MVDFQDFQTSVHLVKTFCSEGLFQKPPLLPFCSWTFASRHQAALTAAVGPRCAAGMKKKMHRLLRDYLRMIWMIKNEEMGKLPCFRSWTAKMQWNEECSFIKKRFRTANVKTRTLNFRAKIEKVQFVHGHKRRLRISRSSTVIIKQTLQ